MNVSAALENVTRLFLDTAPVVYLVERHPSYLSRVEAIFARIFAPDGRMSTMPTDVWMWPRA